MRARNFLTFVLAGFIMTLALASCAPAPQAAAVLPSQQATGQPISPTMTMPAATAPPADTGGSDVLPTASPTTAATSTPPATPTSRPVPTATATAAPTSTPDRTVACSQRIPTDDLFTVVTLTYGLSRDYAPADLVPLSHFLPPEVTLGYPNEIRAVVAQPLTDMVADMQAAGLQPQVISGYRSYSAQAIANEKWRTLEPERASILSAPPGFSEHQLGTVVDFGSPELPTIVGQEDIEFHTWFYKTSEGQWLLENAHRYGFTLSYTREATPVTGFFYEPWHFRYVGETMATQLREMGLSLTEHQLQTEPPPCVPGS